jgi:hypothetical protein
MDTAISSGVRVCTSSLMGECKRASCSLVTPASRSLVMRSSFVRLLPIAPMYPAGVRSAIQLAALHGPMWGTAHWRRSPACRAMTAPMPSGWRHWPERSIPGFLRRFGDRLKSQVINLLGVFVPRVEQYLRDRPGPHTVVHGDFRADNLVVNEGQITVLDWQTAAHGPRPRISPISSSQR